VDGGRSWILIARPTTGYDLMHSGGFLSPQQGWLNGIARLFWTDDGGATWEERPIPQESRRFVMRDVRFLTPEIAVAIGWLQRAGEPSSGPGPGYTPEVYRTEDGGRTWTHQAYANREAYRDLRGSLGWLEFADEQHGLSVELNATFFTRDGGRTWKKSRYCADVNIRRLREAWIGTDMWGGTSAQLLDVEYGWWTVEGDLFRTTNGGETWCRLPSVKIGKDAMRIQQMRFVSRDLGWAVLNGMGVAGELPMFETHDGGQSWRPIKFPSAISIYGMSVVSGTDIILWNNTTIYRLIRD
jgi:photosystem II stability/assembly factor-like uncharacterized protein